MQKFLCLLLVDIPYISRCLVFLFQRPLKFKNFHPTKRRLPGLVNLQNSIKPVKCSPPTLFLPSRQRRRIPPFPRSTLLPPSDARAFRAAQGCCTRIDTVAAGRRRRWQKRDAADAAGGGGYVGTSTRRRRPIAVAVHLALCSARFLRCRIMYGWTLGSRMD